MLFLDIWIVFNFLMLERILIKIFLVINPCMQPLLVPHGQVLDVCFCQLLFLFHLTEVLLAFFFHSF